MSGFLANFHFLRPWWLVALVALPLLWRMLAQRSADPGAWRGAVDAHLLQYLLTPGDDSTRARLPSLLAACAWTLACVALAGPAWEKLPQALYQNRAARVFALELAPSMAAQDLKPSRYERARYKIADLLKRSGDMQTALIAFAGDAFIVAPLTDDANTVANLVDALDPTVMPAPGNDTGRAIDLGAKLIHQAGLDGGELVLLADAADANAVAAARRARATGVVVSVLGVGTTQGAPVPLAQGGFLKNAAGDIVLPKLDADALAGVAQAGGGRYIEANADAADLEAILGTALARNAGQVNATQLATTRFGDRGPWLVLLLVPLVALGFRRGWLTLLPLALAAHSPSASAFAWTDMWQRADQQARAALDAGHAQQAQALARDPQLRGAAAYRADDFAAAAQNFELRDDADAAYNRGNALAKQQRYEEAIAAYDRALQSAPDMGDAVANKRAVEAWLKQQEAQQNKQNQQNQQNKDPNPQGSKDKDQPGGKNTGDRQQDDGQQQKGPAQERADKDKQDGSADNIGSSDAGREAEKKYQERMNKELTGQQDSDKKGEPEPVRLGKHEGDSAQDERTQAVEQWLQRVPDDPGGLLRRKFQLEYQLRQHGGKSGDSGK